jgi:hypothetical protein
MQLPNLAFATINEWISKALALKLLEVRGSKPCAFVCQFEWSPSDDQHA